MTSASGSWGSRLCPSLPAGVLVFLLGAMQVFAQSDTSDKLPTQQKIHDRLAALHAQEQAHAGNLELGYQWALLGVEYAKSGDFANSESAYNHSLKLLDADTTRSQYAEVLDQLGALYRIYGRIAEALNCRHRALAVREQMGDPLEIARSRSRLAELAFMSRKYKDAADGADQAYQVMVQRGDQEKSDLISTLIVRADARCALHKCAEGLADAHQAVTISRGAYPPDSIPVAASLMALGSAEMKNGATAEAEETIGQAVEIFKGQVAPTDPRLNYAMQRYRDCLLALNRKDEARAIHDQLENLNHQTPLSCSACTVSAYGLRPQTH
jgi:tetratricopeptide (TPR) repeat protein